MNLIVAVDLHNAIGVGNELLDHFPRDLQHFKCLTTGKVVVMGKNTYYSLPKRPLPNRINIVLSSTMKAEEGCIVCNNMEELFTELDKYNDEDIFVIGGGNVYAQLYPYCNKFYVTKIYKKYENANRFFHEFDEIQTFNWTHMQTIKDNDTMLDFRTYERII